ncbi:MAG: glycosyltransferase [Legionellales bacterium]|nr:glycosyltransferase [Legionellales bacterium]
MRLLIDLQDYQLALLQSHTTDHPVWLLTQAWLKATQQSAHQVWVLLNNQLAESIELIKYQLSDLIPVDHICIYDIPLPETTIIKPTWSSAAHALVLQQHFESFKPDVVLFSQPTLTLFATLPTTLNHSHTWSGTTVSSHRSLISQLKSSAVLRDLIQFILLPATQKTPAWLTAQTPEIICLPTSKSTDAAWQQAAQSCLTIFEHSHCQQTPQDEPTVSITPKPTLAYLGASSPPPPWLTDLNVYYDVTVIIESPLTQPHQIPETAQSKPSLSWFLQQADQFDFIIYHLANTLNHLPLLHAFIHHPGIIFTDDFYFDRLYPMAPDDVVEPAATIFPISRYHAQGYCALQQSAACHQQIFHHALGILTDDPTFIDQCHQYYGSTASPPIYLLKHSNQSTSKITPTDALPKVIETMTHNNAQVQQRTILAKLATLTTQLEFSEHETLPIACCLANHFTGWQPPQLLIDASLLEHEKTKTGIGRVLNSITQTLLTHPPTHCRIEPVRYDQHHYRYARQLTSDLLEIDLPDSLTDEGIDIHPNDIFLVADIYPDRLQRNKLFFQRWQNRGAKLYFIVYDLIPYLHPNFFEPRNSREFQRWLMTISQLADGLICDSRAVADELRLWLQQHNPMRYRPLSVGYFHLGADIDTGFSSQGLPDQASSIIQAMQHHPSFLMVSTIEPRKGHAQAIDAFEQLWQHSSLEVNLIIIGKQGWLVDKLIKRIQQHPELNRRLFWLGYVSDEFLNQLYAQSTALLVASEAEGFGLPLIEAARHDIPLIIRDLPVFREVAGEHAFYFKADTPTALAEAIKNWLGLFKHGSIPASGKMPWLTWEASTQQLLRVLYQQQWYFTYQYEPNSLMKKGSRIT